MFNFLKKSDFFDAYCKFLPFIKPCWFLGLLGILLTIPVGALDAVVAWFLKPFMDHTMVNKDPQFSSLVPYFIVGFTFIQGMFIYLASWVNGYVGSRITLDIRKKLYNKLLHMDCKYYDQNNSGQIIFRYFNDAELASTGLINNIKLFLTKFFSSVALTCVLFYNSWQLSLIAVGVLVFLILPMRIVRKKISKITKKTVISSTAILTIYNETFGGNKIIKSYNLRKTMSEKFLEQANFITKLAVKLIRDTNWLSPVMHVVSAASVAIVIYVGGEMIINNTITSGTFVSFIAALLMLYTPLKSIGNNYIEVQKSILALTRIYEIFESESFEEQELAKKLPNIETINNCIEFDNVHFSYVPEREILKGVSFKVMHNQTIALVGNSGGGKSTICALIPRLYELTGGKILIDGVDIKNYNIDSLRNIISYVFQDNFLFEGTLKENITLGNENASEEDIKQAIKDACLEDFIHNLPDGLETHIGERGILLSGGQKQRVAIARAFIKNAPILILDEATSALDNKSEKVVQQAINNLMQNRTVMIIAHRLSTIQNADQIIVIQDGNIVEQGKHEDLIALKGFYANLYNAKLADKQNKENENDNEDAMDDDKVLSIPNALTQQNADKYQIHQKTSFNVSDLDNLLTGKHLILSDSTLSHNNFTSFDNLPNSTNVVVIENGKITIKGLHKELLLNNKSYKSIIKSLQ
jgi:subfamily B ATP-binding cassette protein MsbA